MPNKKYLLALVDDDASVRRALTRLLCAAGYEVRTFGSAEEFLLCTDRDFMACLILDIKLPGMSGFDLYCSGVHAPTIFITADERHWARAEALHIRREMFLYKPCSDYDLLFAVKSALGMPPASTNRTEPVISNQ